MEASFGAELVRQVTRTGFALLKRPPFVLGGWDVPVPFSPVLERAFVPQVEDIIRAITELCSERGTPLPTEKEND